MKTDFAKLIRAAGLAALGVLITSLLPAQTSGGATVTGRNFAQKFVAGVTGRF